MASYVIASASGLASGTAFFLLFSLVLGGIAYVFLTKPWARHRELGAWTVRAPIAITVAALVVAGLFSALYFSAVAGFHNVVVGDGNVRIDYPMLERSVAVPVSDIVSVERPFAHKGRYRLVIRTRAGGTLESAAGTPTAVREAAEAVEREIDRVRNAGPHE